MYRHVNKLLNIPNKRLISSKNRYLNSNSHFDVKEEVMFALETGKPVIALESTIITHGMPFPDNIKCAFEVENIVRNQGVVPATVAIVDGRVKVGLSKDELTLLGDTKTSNPIKTSRRDFPYVISNKLNGGTTVCGTLIVANRVGIPIFATGGIGGVHRGAHKTFDISSDLIEIGKSGVAVVSSGVKSILDIPKTLEYLETQGVFVATYGNSNEFPAFYLRVSGSMAPYCVKTPLEAARVIECSRQLELHSGLLFAVPVPEEDSLYPDIINNAIEEALKGAKGSMDVLGKNVTPYLLSTVSQITGGKSLQTNIALIKNNAKVAAEIAVELATLEGRGNSIRKIDNKGRSAEELKGRPVVIGGSNLDCSVHLNSKDIKLDGRIHDGRFLYSAGGVARNICESLSKLGHTPNFLSVLGDDEPGRMLKKYIPKESSSLLKVLKGHSTAQCIVVFDRDGECKFLTGDMHIHKQINADMIRYSENVVKDAPLIIIDANLTVETIEEVLKIATQYSIPVLFEPTDVEISDKIFRGRYWRAVKLITPNLNELKHIAACLEIPPNTTFNTFEQTACLAKQLTNYIENVIVTLGPSGVLIARKSLASEPFFKYQQTEEVCVRHYSCNVVRDIVNVSGAGDCLASGIAAGALAGLPEENCVSVGFAAAELALFSQSPVPEHLFNNTHESWNAKALFKTIEM